MQNGNSQYEHLRRRLRLIGILDVAENAGLCPLPIRRLHMLGYLSNTLAPVWNMPVLEGKVLKRQAGPFYPALQQDLDRLVGMGIVKISALNHKVDEDGKWRLEGKYHLNRIFAEPILAKMSEFFEEYKFQGFIQELAFGLAALGEREFDLAMSQEATYSDPRVDYGNVVDFAEWQQRNFTANAANRFEHLLASGGRANPAEKIHLYVRHLHTRISRGY